MALQASVARQLLEQGRSEAWESICAVENRGRATLVEMRRLLVLVRERDLAVGEPVPQTRRPANGSVDGNGPVRALRSGAPIRIGSRARSPARQWIEVPWIADAMVVLGLAATAVIESILQPCSSCHL